MAKRRLSKQQQRRIQDSQERRIERSRDRLPEMDEARLGREQEGLVIANFGRQLIVEAGDGRHISCKVKPTLEAIVSGDRVVWQAIEEQQADSGLVVALLPRRSLLSRPGFGGKPKPVAANIDRIFIVTAPLPALNEGMLDRYLVAAESSGIDAAIVFNKTDLLDETGRREAEAILAVYAGLGYPVLYTSTKLEHGMDSLLDALRGSTSILVGQSGVGKSSLIGLLLPHEEIKVGDVSMASRKGAHTTTAARLYHLQGGGELIDSPGVREFGLASIEPQALAAGFREFRPFLGHCRFRDCNHRDAEGCEVQSAVQRGEIGRRRYESYLRILESLEQGNR
jgi:ribosome biogenesis GTPase